MKTEELEVSLETEKSTPQAAASPVIWVGLHEFCARLSVSVKSPELISAFEHTERVIGRMQDTEDAYKLRFAAFVNTPV